MNHNFGNMPDQPLGQPMCTMPGFTGQTCDNAATCGNGGCTKQAAADRAAQLAQEQDGATS